MSRPDPQFEVQTFTFVDGWVNIWEEDGKPLYFGSREEAEEAIDEFFDDLPVDMVKSYSRDDYRVWQLQ